MSHKNNIENPEVVTVEIEGEKVNFENKILESGKRVAEILIPVFSTAAFNSFTENLRNKKYKEVYTSNVFQAIK